MVISRRAFVYRSVAFTGAMTVSNGRLPRAFAAEPAGTLRVVMHVDSHAVACHFSTETTEEAQRHV